MGLKAAVDSLYHLSLKPINKKWYPPYPGINIPKRRGKDKTLQGQNSMIQDWKFKLPEGCSNRMLEVTGFKLRKRETYFDATTRL